MFYNYCKEGHKLTWITESHVKTCDCKKDQKIHHIYGRWECQICNEKYCINCHPHKITKNKCPLNHNMYLESNSKICELCLLKSERCMYDKQCNFALCKECIFLIDHQDIKNSIYDIENIPLPFDAFDFSDINYTIILNNDDEEIKNDYPNEFHLTYKNPILKIQTQKENEPNSQIFFIDKKKVHSFFCSIELKNNSLFLHNQTSENKVIKYPLGLKVNEHEIINGDIIKVGEYYIKLIIKGENLEINWSSTNIFTNDKILESKEIEPSDSILLGRDYLKNKELRNCKAISRKHAKILYQDGVYKIHDWRSREGLFLLLRKNENKEIILDETKEIELFIIDEIYKLKIEQAKVKNDFF